MWLRPYYVILLVGATTLILGIAMGYLNDMILP